MWLFPVTVVQITCWIISNYEVDAVGDFNFSLQSAFWLWSCTNWWQNENTLKTISDHVRSALNVQLHESWNVSALSSPMTRTGVERCGASSPTSSSTQTATTSASTASFRSRLVSKIHYLANFVNKFDWFEFPPWRNPSRDVANGLERLGPDCRFVLCRSHNGLPGLVNSQPQAVPRRGLCRCLRPHLCSSGYVAKYFGCTVEIGYYYNHGTSGK